MTKKLLSLHYLALGVLGAVALSACSFMSQQTAPVDARVSSSVTRGVSDSRSSNAPAVVRQPTGPYQNMAGKPGYYTVLPGDTVYAIARSWGVSARDLIAWNRLDNPNTIEVGRVLILSAPSGMATVTPVPDRSAPSQPVTASPVASTGSTPSKPPETSVARPAQTPASVSNTDAAAAIDWTWPSNGRVVTRFDGNRSKGIDIVGQDGSDVVAAADGVVMIAAQQRGYGNLLVLKHSDDVLTAYAHNRSLLVAEGQRVKRGQVVAKMGNLDTDRVKLHFQIRIKTQPVNPERYLPVR